MQSKICVTEKSPHWKKKKIGIYCFLFVVHATSGKKGETQLLLWNTNLSWFWEEIGDKLS